MKLTDTIFVSCISGWYDLPVDIFFSLPVKFQKGAWEVVQDRQVTTEIRAQLDQITNELIHERYVIFPPPKADTPPPEPSTEEEPTPVEDADKVIGEGEKEKEKEDSSGTEGETSSSQESRSGNLSRIAEESESDATKGRPGSQSEVEKSKPATPQAAEAV